MKRFLSLLTASMILSGCSGSIYTALTPIKETDKDAYKGVLVHPMAMFKDVYQTTSLVSKDGKLLGHSSAKIKKQYNEWISNGAEDADKPAVIYCVPLQYQKLVIRPDFSKNYQVWYEPGVLETHEFGLSLENGAIVSVNSKGTPDRGQTAKTVAETAALGAGLLFSLDVLEEKKHQVLTHERTIVRPTICNHGEQLIKAGEAPNSTLSEPDLPNMEFGGPSNPTE